MFDEERSPAFRQSILKAVGLIVVILCVWLLLWLIFFRHPAKNDKLHGANTSQNQASNQNSSSKNKSSNTNSSTDNTTSATTNNSSQLANTGPGDVFVPVAAAAVVGTVLYQVRLRRKLKA